MFVLSNKLSGSVSQKIIIKVANSNHQNFRMELFGYIPLQRGKLCVLLAFLVLFDLQTHKYIEVSVCIVAAVELKDLVKTAHTHACLFVVDIAGMTQDHSQDGFRGDIRLQTDRQTDGWPARQKDRWTDTQTSCTMSTPTQCPAPFTHPPLHVECNRGIDLLSTVRPSGSVDNSGVATPLP